MARNDAQINLYVPPDFKREIQQLAKAHQRSVTAEIISRLQASINADEFSRGAESGDPYAAALAASETIRTATKVLDKALLKIGVEEGRVQIGEETETYQISPVNDDEMELLQRMRQASPELRKAVFDLLTALGRKQGPLP